MAHYVAVNHDRQLIAIFSPKCGSNTIKAWFYNTLGIKEPDVQRHFSRYMISPAQIGTYPHYRKVFFIRNPFRRLVSFYARWVVRNHTTWCFADDRKRFLLHDKSFCDFVHILNHLWGQRLAFQHHLKPQTLGLIDLTFDHIVKLETFDSDIELLNQRLGIHFTPHRLNATAYDPLIKIDAFACKPDQLRERNIPTYECFYNADLIDIVCRIYNQDVTYYYRHALVAIDLSKIVNPDNDLPNWVTPVVRNGP